MAISIKTSLITEKRKKDIKNTCIIRPPKTQYNSNPTPISCFEIEDSRIYIPLGIWKQFYSAFPNKGHEKIKLECKKELFTKETDPKGYRDQDIVFLNTMEQLKNKNTAFIAASCGFGKTTMGNYIACHLGLKTAVICHIDKVNEQWEEEFINFSNAKVQRVKGNVIDPGADVYIFGVQKAAKFSREELKHIGFVIFDEAHISTITAFSKTLLKFAPQYVLGLSATPKRADGMQKLFEMYFGNKEDFISRHEVKDFEIRKVCTTFAPDVRNVIVNGKPVLDWNFIINSISENEERQNFIVDLILKHPKDRIMVLSDRKIQCTSLYNKLLERGETDVQLLIGSAKTKSTRIIIASTKKAGVGFNDPTLTMLILASDCKSVEQFEGRIRTTNNIIYDIVDDFITFHRHWNIREKWYIKRGATIKNVDFIN